MNRSRLCPRRLLLLGLHSVVLIGLFFQFTSCAAIKEGMKKRVRPAFISGSPDSTGLVIVDTNIFYNPDSQLDLGSIGGLLGSLTKALVSDVVDDLTGDKYGDRIKLTGARIQSDTGEYFTGQATRTGEYPAVVFSNLKPGSYHVTELKAERSITSSEAKEYYNCSESADLASQHCPESYLFYFKLSANDSRKLAFEIEAGDLHYLGKQRIVETERPPYGFVQETKYWTTNLFGNDTLTSIYVSKDRTDEPEIFYYDYAARYEKWALEKIIKSLKEKSGKSSSQAWNDILDARLAVVNAAADGLQ
jgi:hypothetical protein